MSKGKLTIMPDNTIKVLNTKECRYEYLENKLVDEFGELTIYIDGDRRHPYAFFDLSNDPVADTIKKCRHCHGRTPKAEEQYEIRANKIEGHKSLIERVTNFFHS